MKNLAGTSRMKSVEAKVLWEGDDRISCSLAHGVAEVWPDGPHFAHIWT